jgi:putative ABC transport system permease protein
MLLPFKSSYRSLANRPGFSIAAVLTLAVCIGANSAIFSLIDAVLLKPLPYAHPAELTVVFETNAARKTGLVAAVAPARLEDWNRMTTGFKGIGGVYTESVTETSGPTPEKLVSARTSPRFFSVMGVLPLRGREFTAAEEHFGGPGAILIGETLWRRRFAGDPNIIGVKSLRIGDSLYPITGILPASFRMPMTNAEIDVWMPAALPRVVMQNREASFYLVIARLKDRVFPANAQADMDAVQARLAAQFGGADARWKIVVKPLKEVTVGSSRRGLRILLAAVTLVLLIGCANIACLLLAQGPRRAREVAIRFSLGAQRSQVVWQLLCEAFLVSLPGAVLGLLFSAWGTDLLRNVASQQLPRGDEIQLTWPVVWFTLSLGVATTFLCGLIPAMTATRGDTAVSLAQGSRAQSDGPGQTLLRLLVGGQVALAIVLLVGAGLLIRTIASLTHVPLGFQASNILTFHISAAWSEKRDGKGVQHRLERTLQALESVPGVQSAALALTLPGAGAPYNLEFHIAGRGTTGPGEKLLANMPAVSGSYFHTLGIPLLAGRGCRDNIDTTRQESVVNREFAERFFQNDNPIGHILRAAAGAATNTTLIVGVVENARDTNRTEQPEPAAYWCTAPSFWPDPVYLIKTQGPPMALANTLRKKIKQLEPSRALYDVAPLEEQLSSTMGERKLQTALLSVFGLSALLLAAVGLYGVLGFYVSQGTREIGLRIALGARPDQIFAHVFQQGALMTIGGIAVGIAAGAAATQLIFSLLYGVSRWDPLSFLAAPALLTLVAALAIWLPSRRAMLLDPIVALREE